MTQPNPRPEGMRVLWTDHHYLRLVMSNDDLQVQERDARVAEAPWRETEEMRDTVLAATVEHLVRELDATREESALHKAAWVQRMQEADHLSVRVKHLEAEGRTLTRHCDDARDERDAARRERDAARGEVERLRGFVRRYLGTGYGRNGERERLDRLDAMAVELLRDAPKPRADGGREGGR